MRGMTINNDPVYGAALKETCWDRHIRGLNEDDPTYRDRVLLLIWQRLARNDHRKQDLSCSHFGRR